MPTLKQFAIENYLDGVEIYRKGIKSKDSHLIVIGSLKMMANKGQTPKRYWVSNKRLNEVSA